MYDIYEYRYTQANYHDSIHNRKYHCFYVCSREHPVPVVTEVRGTGAGLELPIMLA